MMNDIRYSTVAELARGLKRKQYSAVELATATLALLETHGPRYNAVAAVMRARALDAAKRADRASGGPRSALHGLPYGAEDLVAARGPPATWGAPPAREPRFDGDAPAV